MTKGPTPVTGSGRWAWVVLQEETMIKQADMRVELPIVLDACEGDPPETAAAKAILTGGKLVVCSAPREALLTAGTVVSFEIKAADAPTQVDLAALTLGEPKKR